jgi:4-hydroxybenzoate polyprenyltransferase
MVLVKYSFFEVIGIETALSEVPFLLLVLSVVCIAAGGNVINDIYDTTTDRINKPTKVIVGTYISEKNATLFYMALTTTGVIAGFIVSNFVGKPNLAAVFIITAALLYAYAIYIKNGILINNILVAGLIAFVLITMVLFDLYPNSNGLIYGKPLYATQVVLHYTWFAFGLNLLREIVKDIHDSDGDKNAGRNTIPIVLGRQRTIYLVFGITIAFLAMVLYYLYNYVYIDQILMGYFLLFIIAPLMLVIVKTWNATSQKDLMTISTLLKVVMLLGVCSISLYYRLF